MTWSLKWGEHVKAFEAHAKRTGVKPAPLLNRPRLLNGDLPYYNAFGTLSRSRPAAFNGSAAIPVSEVLALLQLVGIANQRERVKYLRIVQDLDQICLKHWSEAQTAAAK